MLPAFIMGHVLYRFNRRIRKKAEKIICHAIWLQVVNGVIESDIVDVASVMTGVDGQHVVTHVVVRFKLQLLPPPPPLLALHTRHLPDPSLSLVFQVVFYVICSTSISNVFFWSLYGFLSNSNVVVSRDTTRGARLGVHFRSMWQKQQKEMYLLPCKSCMQFIWSYIFSGKKTHL